MNTHHANIRAQQRGVPPLVCQWLDEYGHEEYDGHGGVQINFTKKSIRAMERDFGREPVRRMDSYFGCYKVISSRDGATLTIGYRTKHLRRK